MKKVTTLLFLLTLAIGAEAQFAKVPPVAHVGPAAHGKAAVTNSTVPPASRQPNAVNRTKKK